MKYVTCPTCGKQVAWSTEEKWRPFCSERCRLIDLGEWAAEGYRIPERESTIWSEDDASQPQDD